MENNKILVVVRGGGDLATGVIHRLVESGFPVVVLETKEPTVIRRTVAFAEAIYTGTTVVEGIRAEKVNHVDDVWNRLMNKVIPILVDPEGKSLSELKPHVVIDAILAKRNFGTSIGMAPIVIGLGPGFCAGEDVHAVIETNRGHHLGRVYYEGTAEPNTGVPGDIGGYTLERILRSPAEGIVKKVKDIATVVKSGEIVAYVGDKPVHASIDGVLRGMIQEGLWVEKGFKIGDIDPRCKIEHCYSISDKARSIGGGVLEAILHLIDFIQQDSDTGFRE